MISTPRTTHIAHYKSWLKTVACEALARCGVTGLCLEDELKAYGFLGIIKKVPAVHQAQETVAN